MKRIDTLTERLMFLKTCIVNRELPIETRRKAFDLYIINLSEALQIDPKFNHRSITLNPYD